MKILLVQPPWQRFFGNAIQSAPIALRYLGAYLRREIPAIEVDIYNADFSPISVPTITGYSVSKKHQHYLTQLNDLETPLWQEVREKIKAFKPSVVGISAMTASYCSALNVCKIVKTIDRSIIVVMGGKHPSALPTQVLRNHDVDFVVIGEGEETLKELILKHNRPSSIQGLAYRNSNGEIFVNPPRNYLDINNLPLPLFDSSLDHYPYEKKSNTAPAEWIITSARGCPFQCIYCASEKKVRFRSAKNIEREILEVKRRYKIDHFSFTDDTIFINKKMSLELCKMLQEHNIRWSGNVRVDQVDDNLVHAMKTSGCFLVSVGIESASAETLKRIKKKISLEQVLPAIKLFRKHGILVNAYFMIGFPWETEIEMNATLKFIKSLPISGYQLNVVTPLPGTELFDELVAKERIIINELDWSRFHQASLYMNYSDMPDDLWKKKIQQILYKSSRYQKQLIAKKIIRYLLKDPLFTLKRIVTTLRRLAYK